MSQIKSKHTGHSLFSPIKLLSVLCLILLLLGIGRVCFARFRLDPGLLYKFAKPAETQSTSDLRPEEEDVPMGEESAGIVVLAAPEHFTISAIGDLTLASHQNLSDASEWSYTSRLKGDYSYPFQNVIQFTGTDDLTIGNLECTFADKTLTSSSLFYFRAPSERANILPLGSVEFVTTANNHARDFGERGFKANCESLDAIGQAYGIDGQAQIYTTAAGLKVGIYTVGDNSGSGSYCPDRDQALAAIAQLKADGAEYIICMFHWGQELHYIPDSKHVDLAHVCIDAGANLVYGTHPHCLQPVEEYNGGIILYSMGNFSFGGNTDPTDWDTAIVQIAVTRNSDGTVVNDGWTAIPCRCSENTKVNDYKPTPYEESSEGYARIMSKLLGTFEGGNSTKDYSSWYASYS